MQSEGWVCRKGVVPVFAPRSGFLDMLGWLDEEEKECERKKCKARFYQDVAHTFHF